MILFGQMSRINFYKKGGKFRLDRTVAALLIDQIVSCQIMQQYRNRNFRAYCATRSNELHIL